MRIRPAFVFLIATVPVMAAAQQFLSAPPGPPVDPNTRYEVVSIRPADDASGQMMIRMTPGRFESTSVPIGVLLRQALQKPDYQMVGAPGWINTERYSIRATTSDSIPPTAQSVMLLNLLKDRFQLATHLETREQPICHLVVARAESQADARGVSGHHRGKARGGEGRNRARRPASASGISRTQRAAAVRVRTHRPWHRGRERPHHCSDSSDARGPRGSPGDR